MPAGGSRDPAPGRLRGPACPALRPVREELAELGQADAGNARASRVSRKRGSVAELRVLSRSECRGGAPRGERAAISARGIRNDAAHGWMRLSALRLPSLCEGDFVLAVV